MGLVRDGDRGNGEDAEVVDVVVVVVTEPVSHAESSSVDHGSNIEWSGIDTCVGVRSPGEVARVGGTSTNASGRSGG